MENATFNSTHGTFNGTFNGTDGSSSTPPVPKPFWTNLLLPVLYLTILIGSLYTFSSVYRKRQIKKAARLESWFPAHRQRDIYLSLLHMDPQGASESADSDKKLSRVPDSVLKAALQRRALEDIQRIVQLRQSKPALQHLLQRGSVGEELMQRFTRAEKEMEEEVKDVVNEANAFAEGWGQVIFQSANEMNQNRLIKERTTELLAKVEAEKAWWEKRKTTISSSFMQELEAEKAKKDTETALAAAKKNSSDDDAVLVEAGGPATGFDAGKAQKRKGKK